PLDDARWHLWLVGALILCTVALLLLGGVRRQRSEGLQPSLHGWLHALVAVEGPVRIGVARFGESGSRRPRLVAARLAASLRPPGAVVPLAAHGRLLWFERAGGRLGVREVVVASAGVLSRVRLLPEASDGRRALEAALAAGVVAAPADPEPSTSDS